MKDRKAIIKKVKQLVEQSTEQQVKQLVEQSKFNVEIIRQYFGAAFLFIKNLGGKKDG